MRDRLADQSTAKLYRLADSWWYPDMDEAAAQQTLRVVARLRELPFAGISLLAGPSARTSTATAPRTSCAGSVVRIDRNGETAFDANGYPEGKVAMSHWQPNDYHDRLPEPMRVKTGHGGSHAFLTHEFILAIVEDRHPSVNVWEAATYTAPGIVAHASALASGEPRKIPDFGNA